MHPKSIQPSRHNQAEELINRAASKSARPFLAVARRSNPRPPQKHPRSLPIIVSLEGEMDEQESTPIAGRKRELEVDPSQELDQRDSETSEPATKVPALNSVMDEIDLHFQRSLAKVKPPLDGDHTHQRLSPLGNERQNRDSPSPNHQSRQTPPTSYSTPSPSSLSSSPRRHGIHGHKPLPPPLKLASPTPESTNTHQSHHHASVRPGHHQAIILPTISTATGLTSLSTPPSVRFSSPPSAIAGLPTVAIANGFPQQGGNGAGARTSPPSTLTRTFSNSSGVTQIQTLPTISAAALAAGGRSGGSASASSSVYQNVIPVASAHSLTAQQQRALSQAIANGSSSPKRTMANVSTNATPAVVQNAAGLAAIQLAPGGPVLALPAVSGFQRMTGLTGLNSVGGSGGIQLQAPSVTQPGSFQIIDIPVDNSSGGSGLKSSPPTPLLATAPTLPKAPTVLNVSQIPNLIAINPSSPSSASSSPGNKTPTVKVVSVNGSGSGLISGTQSPIRVSAASTQTTPVATPTMLTPQQLAANPSLMSIIDPAMTSQLVAAGSNAGGPVYVIPAPMVQQPYFIVNPSATPTDLSGLQQLQQASTILAGNPSLGGASLVSNPAGGYILVSPSHNAAAANFSIPLVNLASTSTANSSQPSLPSLIPTSPSVTKTTLKPANITTVLNTTNVSVCSNKPPSSKPLLKNQSSTDSAAASPSHNDVMMTPASVDDHFAQALGPQWNKLKGHSSIQPQHC